MQGKGTLDVEFRDRIHSVTPTLTSKHVVWSILPRKLGSFFFALSDDNRCEES